LHSEKKQTQENLVTQSHGSKIIVLSWSGSPDHRK